MGRIGRMVVAAGLVVGLVGCPGEDRAEFDYRYNYYWWAIQKEVQWEMEAERLPEGSEERERIERSLEKHRSTLNGRLDAWLSGGIEFASPDYVLRAVRRAGEAYETQVMMSAPPPGLFNALRQRVYSHPPGVVPGIVKGEERRVKEERGSPSAAGLDGSAVDAGGPPALHRSNDAESPERFGE